MLLNRYYESMKWTILIFVVSSLKNMIMNIQKLENDSAV